MKLAKCECGGEAERLEGRLYFTKCTACGISTRGYPSREEADSVWTLAMGQRLREAARAEWEAGNRFDLCGII